MIIGAKIICRVAWDMGTWDTGCKIDITNTLWDTPVIVAIIMVIVITGEKRKSSAVMAKD
jgi:hypothetical protein